MIRVLRILNISCFLILAISSGFSQTTLYSYKSGSWNDPDTWTTDPGGTTLVGSKIPENGDIVVILASRLVNLPSNITTTGLDLTINSSGILDLAAFQFTNSLSALRGGGIVRTSSDILPGATINTFVDAGGGTTEFCNSSGFTLPASQSVYNNLVINLSNSSLIATQINDITINGNLKIISGNYRINNNNPARLQLTVYGDVTVYNGSSITTGTGNTTTTTNPIGITGGTAPFVNYYVQNTHRIVIYGDFTNNGTVRFTNQNYPVYNSFPTNGAASVFFMGASHNTLTCNNTTDFYNLIVDKGTDQTFVLSVNSSGYTNFRLFGANTSGGENGGTNPILKKALWIRNGTLRLYGLAVIPSLSEGTCDGGLSGGPNSDFYVPVNGAFVIDGPDVVVLTTADSYLEVNAAYGTTAPNDAAMGVSIGGCSSFSILGKFQIDDGYISARESGGFIYWATTSGQFIINGGNLDAKQFRTANSSGGLTAFRQNGGTLTLRGRFQRTVTGVSDVVSLRSVPLNTTRTNNGINGNVGTFNLDQDANIFDVSGGTIEILDVCGQDAGGISRAFEVNSLPSYCNVSGGSVIIRPTSGTGTNYPYHFVSAAPIGSLSIIQSSGTESVRLTNITKAGVTARNPSLNVLGNISLSGANATLNSDGYHVETGGDFNIPVGTTYVPGNNRTVFDGPGSQTLSANGTITSGLNTLRIDKNSGVLTISGSPASYIIRDSLQIVSGTVDDGGKTLNVAGHIYVSGIHTGAGSINLNGSSNQNITYEISGNPALGNVQLSNTSGATLINNGTMGRFTFSVNALMYIGPNRLTINTSPVTGYSANRYFRTDGIASNGGLRLSVNAASLTTGNNVVFPVGTSGKYTPVTIVGNTNPGSGNGYVSINPVNSVHPSASGSGQKLDYYWRSQATGLPAGSNIYYQCYNNIAGDWSGGINNAAVLISGNTDWLYGGSAGRPNVILNDPMLRGFISADITAGNPGAFNNVSVYFSFGSGNYNSNAVWSTVSHEGPGCGCHPTNASDVIYIGGSALTSRNDSITVTAGFNSSSITINGSYTSNGDMPVFNIQNFGGASTFDVLKGNGKFTTTAAAIPAADYGEFINSPDAVFNYHGGAYTLGTVITSYPNLLITANGNGIVKTLPNSNILVKQDLIISTNYTGNTLRFNGTGGNLTIYGDIKMRNASYLQLTGNTARSLNIYGDINLRYLNSDNANTVNVNAGTGAHQVRFYGDLITMGQSTINLTNSILTIYDPGKAIITDRTGGSGTITFNRLVVSKDVLADTVIINHPFALSGTTNNYPKALELLNGTLILNNSNINLNLSSGGATFNIPQTTAMIIQGGTSVNVTGDNTGILLDGLLRAEDNASIDLGNGSTANNRFIEYTGSGNSVIELFDDASLRVNTQIRRSLLQANGVLKYRQHGNSTTVIYGQGSSLSRAKLEIDNSESEFTMSGGSLTIVRGGGTTYGDLYLRPENGTVSGGTIYLGTSNVGAPQTIKMDAAIALNHLTLDGVGTANEFQLMVYPLLLKGNLLINTGNSLFNANSLDVSVKGNFTNNGTYSPGNNTTSFNGNTQSIGGTSSTTFNNVVINPETSVFVGNHITVNKDLTLTSGTFSTSTFNINIKGNLTNNAIHSGNSANGGLMLNGTSQQLIAGNGTYGRMELNNTAGARLLNHLSLQQDLLLTNGVLNINQYLLTLGTNSHLVGSGFGVNKMIMPDGVYSNVGIRKHFNAGELTTFTYPIGVPGKYTPAELTILDNPSGGNIRLNAINLPHPTVTDLDNVLQYYWEIGSNGISGFEGNLILRYAQSDVAGTEDEYVAARLIVPPGEDWSKAATGSLTDNVDESQNSISFHFPSGTSNLGGEYTAGTDAAIPDEVPVFTSNGDGDWDDITKWTPEAPPGGPNGFIVVIRAGDEISTNGNKRFAYRTTLNGKLNIGTSYGHNLGSVDGTGTLALESNLLPAGRFTSFFNCSGGTLEYGGNTDYTIIADRLDTLRNIYFRGSGNRELPDKDLVICDTLKIDGPSLINTSNRKLTVLNLFQRLNSGSFNSGSGPNATVVFAGASQQFLGGVNGEFTGANALNNVEVRNPAGLVLNSPLQMKGNLLLTEGLISTTNVNLLSMINGNSVIIPAGGSFNSYVSGPISKRIFGGNDFEFPTGKDTRYGKTTLLGVSDGTWQSEYFNSAYPSLTVTVPLTSVSSTEFWHIKGPAANTAYVKLRWDPLSDVTPLATQNGISDIRIAEYNGISWIEKATNSMGDNYNGTAQTIAKMNLDEHDYTLGSISALKPKASFISTGNICAGENLQIAFSQVAASYSFIYTIDGVPNPVTTSSNPYTVNTLAAGRYRITSFTGGVADTNSVLIRPVPVATLVADDASICVGENVTFTAGGGVEYDFRINGISVQAGPSATYSSSSIADGDIVYVYATNSSGCTDASASIIMTVYELPVPTLTGLQIACHEETQNYITDNAPGINNYIWTVTGGTYSGETTHQLSVTWDAIITLYEDRLITVNYTDVNGCSALVPTELNVRVYRAPETGPSYRIPNE